jgi:hypothetical protein
MTPACVVWARKKRKFGFEEEFEDVQLNFDHWHSPQFNGPGNAQWGLPGPSHVDCGTAGQGPLRRLMGRY